MNGKREPRILLMNFTDSDAAQLRAAGYNAELGYIAAPAGWGNQHIPYYSPHPLYDYDVYVYNTEIVEPNPEQKFASLANLADKKISEPLLNFTGPPSVRIAFVGSSAPDRLTIAGIPTVSLVQTNDDVSEFVPLLPSTFAIPELHELMPQLTSSAVRPIRQYSQLNKKDIWPLAHLPVVTNRNRDEIACYAVNTREEKGKPLYLVLPQLKNNVTALLDILSLLRKKVPSLFPGSRGREWLSAPEFLLPDEREIDTELAAKRSELDEFIKAKKQERDKIGREFGFLRQILVATESNEVAPDQRLSTQVRLTLDFLGFRAADVDQPIKNAIKKEAFWIQDGEFFALTEVAATVNNNLKSKEYNELLTRMSVIFKRSDLALPVKKETLSGLLVVNCDIDNHPSARPLLYSGDQEELVLAAKEANIGLLSTVDLHKMAMAVRAQEITKEKAREAIKQFGRITFTAPPSSKAAKQTR